MFDALGAMLGAFAEAVMVGLTVMIVLVIGLAVVAIVGVVVVLGLSSRKNGRRPPPIPAHRTPFVRHEEPFARVK